MKFKTCEQYGECPCVTCYKLGNPCRACLDDRPDGFVVDTDELCELARQFCENRKPKQMFYVEGVLHEC